MYDQLYHIHPLSPSAFDASGCAPRPAEWPTLGIRLDAVTDRAWPSCRNSPIPGLPAIVCLFDAISSLEELPPCGASS